MRTHKLSSATAAALVSAGLQVKDVQRVIKAALREDLGAGPDVTTQSTVPKDQRSKAVFASRSAGCIAGIDIAVAVLEMVCGPKNVLVEKKASDADRVEPGRVLMHVTAPTRGLLTAERTALNLLGHLSGIASATRQWADVIAASGAKVRDTRKTTPGMRALEKYAVRCGGGVNHRMSLSDAALVKDNHIVAAGGVAQAFAAVRAAAPKIAVEIEVDTLEQLHVALGAGADLVLLDNMAPAVLRDAVLIAEAHRATTGKSVILEASGGLTLDNAADVAATGVRYISVGALTHSSSVLDIGLDMQAVV
jgi:nicotinate-nucleotide pyrophosphorylase (carboxylating)